MQNATAESRLGVAPPAIRFDLPPLAAAYPTDASTPADSEAPGSRTVVNRLPISGSGAQTVTFELRLSSMITSPKVPRIDQWLVRCVPRDETLLVDDYSPRTELAGDTVGTLKVKRTKEANDNYGVSVDGTYGHLLRGNAGADHGRKTSELVEYERHAPTQAVVAAGTINRGRGVYFKLRWTRQQVLEGEKTFRVSLRVPQKWRAGLVDVSVVAQTQRKTFGGLDTEIKTLGAAQFSVAIYRGSDQQAHDLAQDLIRAEHELRDLAHKAAEKNSENPLSTLVRRWATALEGETKPETMDSVERLIRGKGDPHVDQRLRKLPMKVRIAALDYCELRDAFQSMNDQPQHSPSLLGVNDRESVNQPVTQSFADAAR